MSVFARVIPTYYQKLQANLVLAVPSLNTDSYIYLFLKEVYTFNNLSCDAASYKKYVSSGGKS